MDGFRRIARLVPGDPSDIVIHLVGLNPSLDLHFDLDHDPRAKVGRIRKECVLPGGKTLNVARFLERMRTPALAWVAGAGGVGPTQRLYQALLKINDPGLSCVLVPSHAPIRFNLHMSRGRGFEKYNHPGFPPKASSLRRLRAGILRRSRPGDLVVLTGRLPDGVPVTLLRDWTLFFQTHGRPVVLDSSGSPLGSALTARPFFLKVNLQEIGEAMQRRFANLKSMTPLLPGLVRRGLSRGAITHGREGALVWEGVRAVIVRPVRPDDRPDVVGAGDGFLAGWLAALHMGISFEGCARQAAACGQSVARSGIVGFRAPSPAHVLRAVRLKPAAP